MSAELEAVAGAGPYAAMGILAIKLWWDDREKKRAKLADEAEAAEKKTQSRSEVLLEKVSESLARVEGDLRDLRNTTANQAGSVAALKERIDGISGDHNPRIKNLELELARIQERMPKGKR